MLRKILYLTIIFNSIYASENNLQNVQQILFTSSINQNEGSNSCNYITISSDSIQEQNISSNLSEHSNININQVQDNNIKTSLPNTNTIKVKLKQDYKNINPNNRYNYTINNNVSQNCNINSNLLQNQKDLFNKNKTNINDNINKDSMYANVHTPVKRNGIQYDYNNSYYRDAKQNKKYDGIKEKGINLLFKFDACDNKNKENDSFMSNNNVIQTKSDNGNINSIHGKNNLANILSNKKDNKNNNDKICNILSKNEIKTYKRKLLINNNDSLYNNKIQHTSNNTIKIHRNIDNNIDHNNLSSNDINANNLQKISNTKINTQKNINNNIGQNISNNNDMNNDILHGISNNTKNIQRNIDNNIDQNNSSNNSSNASNIKQSKILHIMLIDSFSISSDDNIHNTFYNNKANTNNTNFKELFSNNKTNITNNNFKKLLNNNKTNINDNKFQKLLNNNKEVNNNTKVENILDNNKDYNIKYLATNNKQNKHQLSGNISKYDTNEKTPIGNNINCNKSLEKVNLNNIF